MQAFLVGVCEAMNRPVLQLTIIDDQWLLKTLSFAYCDSDTPWSLFEKLRIVAGGSCRNDLLSSLPILSKVGIILCCYQCACCCFVFFRRKCCFLM